MTLFVHRAERADRLVAGLAELLADPLPDVFAEEVVAVPAKGTERWLAQQLSLRLGRRDGRADGICAGVRFPHPSAVVADVLGSDRDDPWAPDALVWPLLEVIDESLGQDWCRTLSGHLGHNLPAAEKEHRRGRRYAVARRLAGLFQGYALHRPAMLQAWSTGAAGARSGGAGARSGGAGGKGCNDTAGSDTDGFGVPLPPDLSWQCELWRRVRDRIDGEDPVVRMARALTQLRADPETVAVPQRISLFGLTRLPVSQLTVLSALAEARDVHLWLTHPSPRLWERIAASGATAPMRRRLDPTAAVPAHPLLSSLGRDSRELQLTLATSPHVDDHLWLDRAPTTLLALLQADLREDRALVDIGTAPQDPDGPQNRVLAPDDRSIQVHACHGAARQVDVLREVLVGLLAADSTLEPRDVLVMCPDIEVYAPLIAAGFGLADVVDNGHPAHRLRVRLADRALAQTNPLLSTMARLLDLADARVTASQVLDLASWPPVRRRFGLQDDDLERLAGWVADAGVRWGLDATRRSRFDLQRFPQNTWRAGIDRLLLGVTMSEQDQNWLGLALPLDDVGSSDIELAGSLAELVSRLRTALDALSVDQPLGDWLDALIAGVSSLTSQADADEWQRAQLLTEISVLRDGAADRADRTVLTLSDVRALLRGRLGGRPTRANFRTGTLTICTMVPMRSVPHRVVCLLGLDDGVFPRTSGVDGDDVIARDPAVGERDPRGEDRQLLLDAILAATEHLVITYAGADERTGATRPPAVPLGELLDTLDDTARAAVGGPARNQVVVRHPLQPFDSRNLLAGKLGVPGPFSFDRSALDGARAATREPVPVPPFLPAPLPPRSGSLDPTDIELADLTALLVHPARGFLRQALDVAVRFEDDEPSDSLTVELDALELWGLGSRLLRDRLAGVDEQTCRNVEWRRGMLPPGPLGGRQLDFVLSEVAPLVDRTAEVRTEPARTVDVVARVPGGRELRGSVPGVHGSRLLAISYSKLGPRDRLRAWIGLVALTASHPETAWTAVTVGRGDPAQPRCSILGPIDPVLAAAQLENVAELYDLGLRAPLPMATRSTAAYAQARWNQDDADAAIVRARRWWITSGEIPGEDADAANEQVWGQRTDLATLLAIPPAADDEHAPEGSAFGALALRLWFPLLAAERTRTL